MSSLPSWTPVNWRRKTVNEFGSDPELGAMAGRSSRGKPSAIYDKGGRAVFGAPLKIMAVPIPVVFLIGVFKNGVSIPKCRFLL